MRWCDMHNLISRFECGIWESKKRIFLSVLGKVGEDEEREQVREEGAVWSHWLPQLIMRSF